MVQPSPKNRTIRHTTQASLGCGFTIIETLVAIAVLLLALGGPLTLAQQSLSSTQVAKDSFTAQYLAQEALELMRFRRDIRFINGWDWMAGLDACIDGPPSTSMCDFNVTNISIVSCGATCPPLRVSSDGFYHRDSASGDPLSRFTRSITIIPVAGNREALLRVTVDWRSKFTSHQIVVEEKIFNWAQ